MINKCPFCTGKTVPDLASDRCTVCGIESDREVAARMARMTPEWRANFIGYFHAANRWAYGWCLPPMSRSEIQYYARGFLSVPNNVANQAQNALLYGDRARRDASWTGRPSLALANDQPPALNPPEKRTVNNCSTCGSGATVVRICMESLDPLLFHGACLACGREGAKGATRDSAQRRWNRANPVSELAEV